MSRKYSVKSKSRRWPLQIFFNILDLAAINAWILYTEATGERISRQDFLLNLAENLSADYTEECHQSKEDTSKDTNKCDGSYKRKTCQIGYCKENKTRQICLIYKKCKCAIEKPIICKKCDSM